VLILNWSSTAEKVDLQLDSAKEEGKVDEIKKKRRTGKCRLREGEWLGKRLRLGNWLCFVKSEAR
jgi:hypothetical protein